MDLANISYIVERCVTLNLILTTVLCFVLTFHFRCKSYSILTYLIFALIFEITGFIIGKLYGYNLFMAPLFSLVDYFIWSRFFTFKKAKQREKLIWSDIILVLYIAFELYQMSKGGGFMIIPGASLAYLFLIIVLIYNSLTALKIKYRINLFIYSLVFVYALFNCIFYLFLNFSIYWKDEYKYILWLLHAVLLHVFYLFLPYYQWKIGKNPQHFLFG